MFSMILAAAAMALTPGGRVLAEAGTATSTAPAGPIEATMSLLTAMANTADPRQRQELQQQVNESYQKALQQLGETSAVLKLRGRIEMMDGTSSAGVKAVLTLERAMREYRREHGQEEVDLLFVLARAYYQCRQTATAREMLYRVVDAAPQFVFARQLLVELLINQHEDDLAELQLAELEKLAPEDRGTIQFRIALLGQQGAKKNRARIDQLLAKLPPELARELRIRAAVQKTWEDVNEGIRLLEEKRAEAPNDLGTVRLLAEVYQQQGQKEKAHAVVKEALKTQPENNDLAVLEAQLRDAPQAEVSQLVLKGINAVKDDVQRELQLFEFYYQQGKQDDASKHLEAAERVKGDDRRVLDVRFQLALAEGTWEAADLYGRRLGEMNADDAHGAMYAFRVSLGKGDVEGAIKIARELTHTMGQFAQSWQSLGQGQQTAGQHEAAISSYTQALQRQSENIEAIRGVVDCYLALGKRDDAMRYIKYGLKHFPGDGWFGQKKIDYELNYGDAAAALDELSAKRDAEMKSADAWFALADAQVKLAQIRQKQGRQADAKDLESKARATLNDAMGRWPDDARSYAQLADLATWGGDFIAGEKSLRQLVERQAAGARFDALLMLSSYYQRAGKFAEAEGALKSAVEKSGGSSQTKQRLAEFYAQRGQMDKAAAVLEGLPSRRALWLQVAQSQLAAGHVREAEEIIRRRLEVSPRDSALLALQGVVYLNTNRGALALASLEKALEADPRNSTALYYRGLLRLKQSPPDPDAALRDLVAARDVSPRGTEIRLGIAEAFRLKGNFVGAASELEGVFALMGDVTANQQSYCTLLLQCKRYRDLERKCTAMLAKALGNDRIWIYLHRGAAEWGLDQKPEATADFETAARLAAESHDDELIRLVALTINETAGSEAALERVAPRMDAENDPAWQIVGAQLYLSRQELNTAAASIERVLARGTQLADRQLALAQNVAASIYLAAGQYEKARAVLDQLLAKYPDDLASLNNVACLLAECVVPPAPHEALRYSTHAMEVARSMGLSDANVLDTHGWVLTLCGKPREGVAYLRTAQSLRTGPLICYHLGEASLRCGETADAVKFLSQAASLAEEAAKQKRPVDAALRQKIETSLKRAKGAGGN